MAMVFDSRERRRILAAINVAAVACGGTGRQFEHPEIGRDDRLLGLLAGVPSALWV